MAIYKYVGKLNVCFFSMPFPSIMVIIEMKNIFVMANFYYQDCVILFKIRVVNVGFEAWENESICLIWFNCQ